VCVFLVKAVKEGIQDEIESEKATHRLTTPLWLDEPTWRSAAEPKQKVAHENFSQFFFFSFKFFITIFFRLFFGNEKLPTSLSSLSLFLLSPIPVHS
jgi:hypothetical protein